MKRSSGVLMHISSLDGEYSIGSFGKEAERFIDLINNAGFSYWQVLPFGLIDECNSPYKSYSAFAGNPYFIDLPTLYNQGLITKSELENSIQNTPYSCEFERLIKERFPLLRKASSRISKDTQNKVDRFIESNKYLYDFCRFMALKDQNNNLPWYEWKESKLKDNSIFDTWKFIQYEFFRQWAEIKNYANQKGVKIIGDIPIYVSLDSCDVWSNPELFCIDDENNPTEVAGVPPDYFCAEGQLWGNPLYKWDVMAKDGYKWWIDRISHQLSMFDGIRIDHFRGFESYWAVPGNEKTAINGKWKKGPGMDLISKLKEIAQDKLIIAEDLGDITPEVVKLVEDSGFPGMRVFQFAFLGDKNTPHLPHNYINNCVAYSGTHDNNTLLGYLWENDDNTRKLLLDYCGFEDPDWGKGCKGIIRTLFGSSAGLVILPIQDLLGYGSDTRLNRPGTSDGNWQYRVATNQFDEIDINGFAKLNQLYVR